MKMSEIELGGVYGLSDDSPPTPRPEIRARVLDKGVTYPSQNGLPAVRVKSLVVVEYLMEGRAREEWAHRIPCAHPPELAAVYPPTEGLVTVLRPSRLCPL